MEATTKRQRRKAARKAAGSAVICIQTKDGLNAGKRLTAAVVDVIDGGFGANLPAPLRTGSQVLVGEQIEAEVRWCVARPDGTFRAGLQYAETISRAYRLLAARYHPDNRESGNSEKFLRICEAYQILSDPAKRARYDASAPPQNQVEQRKRSDGGSHQGRRKGDKLRPSVGALRGWNSALRPAGF